MSAFNNESHSSDFRRASDSTASKINKDFPDHPSRHSEVLPPVTPPMQERFLSKTQTQGSRKEMPSAIPSTLEFSAGA